MPVFPHNFTGDLDAIDWFGEPFALARFGDGEIACIEGTDYVPYGMNATETWTTREQVPHRDALLAALQADLEGYYVGVQPHCCQRQTTSKYVKAPLERQVAATVFSYANHSRFQRISKRLGLRERCTLVAGQGGDIQVPLNGINRDDGWLELVLEQMLEVRDRPILVAAGPAACILVHQYWLRAHERVPCVDIGSAWDIQLWGFGTRMHTAGATRTSSGKGDPMGMRFHECKIHGREPCHPGCMPSRW